MKKLFTSLVAASAVASFAACGKTDAKEVTTDKTTKVTTPKVTTPAITKGKVAKGTFKIGVYGTSSADGTTSKAFAAKEAIVEVVADYSQDVLDPDGLNADGTSRALGVQVRGTGDEYFNLPQQLSLKTSFKKWMKDSADASELTDKTKLAAAKLDALFVAVRDGQANKADVYKTVVERKEFGATKLFFVGDKAKSQSGASSKVFAGGHVSTASFNKYAAAYVAGFQAAVGTIKYSSSEDVYEETTTSFLIGSTSDSEAKKKAFAFRRGVEAAAAHGAYSKYLKVKFVSKTEDSSKSSKKLYREVSEWKAREDSKSKLYEFSSSDTFSDADRRVIYLAGTTAKEWAGYKAATTGTDNDINKFETGDEVGLIGALYNYEALPTSAKPANSLTTKTYARGVWVILDEANSRTAANDDTQKINAGDLSQVTTANKGRINFERHDVKFYGALGKEIAGTTQYATAALQGLYMGGPNYMLGKHTIFGASLDLDYVTPAYDGLANLAETDIWTRGADHTNTIQGVWTASKPKDSVGKAKERFNTSLTHAWEKEVTEAELVKASPWLK